MLIADVSDLTLSYSQGYDNHSEDIKGDNDKDTMNNKDNLL
jgi:hypothetical protein